MLIRTHARLDNLARARLLLRAVEAGASGETLAAFFAPSAVHHAFPSRLAPAGERLDLDGLLARAEAEARLFARQRFEIRHEVADGDDVAIEAAWSASLAEDPSAPPIRAQTAIFLTFRDGEIVRRRLYECVAG